MIFADILRTRAGIHENYLLSFGRDLREYIKVIDVIKYARRSTGKLNMTTEFECS